MTPWVWVLETLIRLDEVTSVGPVYYYPTHSFSVGCGGTLLQISSNDKSKLLAARAELLLQLGHEE